MRCAALGCFVLVLVVAPITFGQQPTFRSGISGVRLDVLVLDGSRPVTGLTSDDFEVLDNGVRQSFRATPASDGPLDVFFVLDRSESVAGETLARLKAAVAASVGELRAADRAALITFAHDVSLDVPVDATHEAFTTALRKVTARGGTAAIDAAYGALTVSEGSGRRTLVLLFSDGFDNRSWLTPAEVVQSARESEAVICGVAFVPRRGGMGDRQLFPHVELLRSLSAATGGEVMTIERGEELVPAFSRILSAMRARYLLTYVASQGDVRGWHEVKVRLLHRRAAVVARPGYFVR